MITVIELLQLERPKLKGRRRRIVGGQEKPSRRGGANDPVKARASRKRWKLAHPEQHKAMRRVEAKRAYWRNPEKGRARVAAYDARKRAAGT